MSSQIDPERFREVLGQYPTGVVVVTAMGPADDALGMTVGSFTSVSIDPPLVAFLPSKMSSSWRSLRESGGSFCVNVLSSDQEDVCRAIAMRKHNKFDGMPWFTARW
jgi:3-hydroxy-9,10-secoandrosta-1,3,5(10)-triene-9,17-dione monooxygenase reductase component